MKNIIYQKYTDLPNSPLIKKGLKLKNKNSTISFHQKNNSGFVQEDCPTLGKIIGSVFAEVPR